jgi:hypothetical protein
MRTAMTLPALGALLFIAPSARASGADPAVALVAGAAVSLAGFAVGGALLANSGDQAAQNNAGWLTIQGGFALAPLVAHGAVGEWGRGAAFASVPTAMFAGTATLFGLEPDAVDHGTLPEQRVIWGLLCAGLFSGALGVVDVAFAPDRARSVHVSPTVGATGVGLQIGGAL